MNWNELSIGELTWLVIGFMGQFLFSCRFLVQWIVSERQKRSVVPVVFWYFSIAGGLTLLAYAIYRQDPVFIYGQLAGLFIYSRNLHLIARERRKRAVSFPGDSQGVTVDRDNLPGL